MVREAETGGCVASRLAAYLLMAVLAVAGALGCAGSDDEEEAVVGSMVSDVQETDAMFVESVRIAMPFKATVYNGAERKIVIRGEDNLLDRIMVVEKSMSNWEITAPFDLVFEQHEDIVIEIPFIEMVSISQEGDGIEFADNPLDVWQGQDDTPAE